jgi:VanZ family protein
MCFIAAVVGSILPGNSPVLQEVATLGVNDQVEHALAYAVLAGLLLLVRGLQRKTLVTLLISLQIMGIALEFVQLFVPGRAAEVNDALADLGGIVLGAVLGYLLHQCLRKLSFGVS